MLRGKDICHQAWRPKFKPLELITIVGEIILWLPKCFSLCVCVLTCMQECVCLHSCGDQKRVLDPQELSYKVVSCLWWALGTELGSSGKVTIALNHWAVSNTMKLDFCTKSNYISSYNIGCLFLFKSIEIKLGLERKKYTRIYFIYGQLEWTYLCILD